MTINWKEYKGLYTYSSDSKKHYHKYSKLVNHEKVWVLELTQQGRVHFIIFPYTKTGEKQIDNVVQALIGESVPQQDKEPLNAINPSHYKTDKGIDLLDMLNTLQINDFCKENAIKYIARAGKKEGNTEIQDLTKAIEYLQRKVKFLKGNLI